MSWQGVLDAVDAAEAWLVAQSFWVQIPLLLVVLGTICWLAAGLIDRVVDSVARRRRYRRLRGRRAAHPDVATPTVGSA